MPNLEKLLKEAEEYQGYLEITYSDDPDEISERMRTLSVYMARSGRMLAEAKGLLNRKKSSEITEMVIKIAKEGFLSAKAQNALVDSIAADEKELVDWLDRINSSCVHQIDALRSLLSYTKEQIRLTRVGY